MNIFYEKQRGDLCRMHSINAFFGFSKLSETEFYECCDEYDKLILGLKSRNMDGFSEGRSIISYILDKYCSKYVLLIPINSYKNARDHLDIDRYNNVIGEINKYFEFNKGHVWFNKKIDKQWYKIDSISGVNKIDIKNLSKNGYLLIIEDDILYKEIEYYILLLKNNKSDKEILYYNLYHSLKLINLNLDLTNDTKFNENLILLKKLHINLEKYINIKRKLKHNKNIVKVTNIINNLINLISL